MRKLWAVAAVGLLSIPGAADEPAADPRVAIHVKAGSNTGGFSDPDKTRADSTKDLLERLRNSKTMRVTGPDEAVILIEVLGRDTKLDQGHAITAFVGGLGQKHSSVTVRLTAGDYTTEFTGTGGASGVFSGYGKAASKVVKELDEWVRANDSKLREIAAQKVQASVKQETVVAKPAPAPSVESTAVPSPSSEAAPSPSPSPSPQVETKQ